MQQRNVKTGWLAFPLVIKEKKGITRNKLQIYLEQNNIQTRTIFTGNILRQPMMKGKYFRKHKKSSIVSNDVMKNGILIGCHHGLKRKELKFMCNTFEKYLTSIKN